MGTWNTKMNGNYTFRDIYQDFFDLYNEGQNPVEVSKQIRLDSADMFDDYDDRNNSLFALALAQWETRCLDAELLNEIRSIIETGNDIELWKSLGADNETIQERKQELSNFLTKISAEKDKAKRRIRKKFDFEAKRIVNVVAPDKLKEFHVSEEYIDKKYIHTSGVLMWEQGGGSILYFEGEGKYISAMWIDSAVLEITHDKTIAFSKKEEKGYYCGDTVQILYKAQ